MSKRALCLIREPLVYRRQSFIAGLRAAGYMTVNWLPDPKPGDVLVIWNRYGHFDDTAKTFEKAGASVVVTENGYLGKGWLNDRWFALALGQHAGGGQWRTGDDARWDSLNVTLEPWRENGSEVLILGQRGIGSPEVRSPPDWAERTRAQLGQGRVRPHPGKTHSETPLEDDLRGARCVVTWASSAALHALRQGIPVWYAYSKWIGAGAARLLAEWGAPERKDDAARLGMFRRLIWAMWRVREIEDGSAFRHLLGAAQ